MNTSSTQPLSYTFFSTRVYFLSPSPIASVGDLAERFSLPIPHHPDIVSIPTFTDVLPLIHDA
jgi:hypothetical protein